MLDCLETVNMLKGFVQYCIYEPLIPTWWSIRRGIRPLDEVCRKGGNQGKINSYNPNLKSIVHVRFHEEFSWWIDALPMPLHDVVLTTIKHLGFCWTSADNVPKTRNRPALSVRAFDSTFPKKSESKTSQSRCLRSCCSRCCSPGRFRESGLVVAAAAQGKTCKNPQEMLRDLGLEPGERKLGKRQGESRDRNRWVIMTKLIAYPIFYKVLYIPGGAEFGKDAAHDFQCSAARNFWYVEEVRSVM